MSLFFILLLLLLSQLRRSDTFPSNMGSISKASRGLSDDTRNAEKPDSTGEVGSPLLDRLNKLSFGYEQLVDESSGGNKQLRMLGRVGRGRRGVSDEFKGKAAVAVCEPSRYPSLTFYHSLHAFTIHYLIHH